jgi:hypothetical protein
MFRYYDWKITPDGQSIIWIKQTEKKTIVVCDYNGYWMLSKEEIAAIHDSSWCNELYNNQDICTGRCLGKVALKLWAQLGYPTKEPQSPATPEYIAAMEMVPAEMAKHFHKFEEGNYEFESCITQDELRRLPVDDLEAEI